MHLSDQQREEAFPVHIDLGRKESNGPALAVDQPNGKKGKARTYYPTAYIDNVPGLEALPKEGCMLVEFRRTSLRVDTPEDGKDTAGVTIELRRICLAEDASGDSEGDMQDAMKRFAKDKGVADAGDDSAEEADEDTPDDEDGE